MRYRICDLPEFYRETVSEFARGKNLSRKEESILLRSAKKGNREAQNNLILMHQRRIIKIALQVANGYKLPELIQEGNIGLIRAIKKFNFKTGCRFATYSYWWIKQEMLQFFKKNASEIRLPEYIQLKKQRLKKKMRIDLTESDIREIDKQSKMGRVVMSVDAYDYENRVKFLEKMGEDTTTEIDKRITIKKLIEKSGLSPQELKIILARFDGETLLDIGNSLGCCRERVRQIEGIAVQKLRDAYTKLSERKGLK